MYENKRKSKKQKLGDSKTIVKGKAECLIKILNGQGGKDLNQRGGKNPSSEYIQVKQTNKNDACTCSIAFRQKTPQLQFIDTLIRNYNTQAKDLLPPPLSSDSERSKIHCLAVQC